MIQNKYINGIVAVAVVFALIVTLLLVGLSNSEASSSTALGSRVEQQYETKLFGVDIISIDIIANQSDWDSMLENATAEEYIMVDVVINGTKFQSVGIRPKGNSSLTQVARDSTSDRFSFRLKFDQYIKGQTCFGLDTFVVNNMLGDNSYMKEYLSYDILNYIGVDTPLYNFTNITVNGKVWGLYLAIEAYDDSYLSRVYGDTTGNLYNVKSMDLGNNDNSQLPAGGQIQNMPNGVQIPNQTDNKQLPNNNTTGPQTQIGNQRPNQQNTDTQNTQGNKTQATETTPNVNGQVPNAIRGNDMGGGIGGAFGGGIGGRGSSGGDLKYSDDKIGSYSAIFNNAIGKTTEEDQQKIITALKNLSTGTELETYFDVDQILRYMAAHTLVVNLDSYSSSMAQNYYIYEKDGQITILPWDYNFSFGGFQSGTASAVINFPIDTPVSGITLESRPLFDKLLANEEYKAKYHEYLNEIITGYFSNGKWADKLAELDKLIAGYVESDTTAFCTFEEYKKALPALTTLGELRAESIMRQLDGTIPATTAGQTENSKALISAGSLTLSDLGSGMGGGNNVQGNAANGKGIPIGGAGVAANMPDAATMQKAMEIIQAANGKTFSEEQMAQLTKLGLTKEQITSLQNIGSQFGGGVPNQNGRGIPNQNGGVPNGNMQKPNDNTNIQNNIVQSNIQDSPNNIIIVSGLVILLLVATAFVSKRRYNY